MITGTSAKSAVLAPFNPAFAAIPDLACRSPSSLRLGFAPEMNDLLDNVALAYA